LAVGVGIPVGSATLTDTATELVATGKVPTDSVGVDPGLGPGGVDGTRVAVAGRVAGGPVGVGAGLSAAATEALPEGGAGSPRQAGRTASSASMLSRTTLFLSKSWRLPPLPVL
jgi:hypothetical protein